MKKFIITKDDLAEMKKPTIESLLGVEKDIADLIREEVDGFIDTAELNCKLKEIKKSNPFIDEGEALDLVRLTELGFMVDNKIYLKHGKLPKNLSPEVRRSVLRAQKRRKEKRRKEIIYRKRLKALRKARRVRLQKLKEKKKKQGKTK